MRLRRSLVVVVISVAAAMLVPGGALAASSSTPTVSGLVNGGFRCAPATRPQIVGMLGDILQVLGTDSTPGVEGPFEFDYRLWTARHQADALAFTDTRYGQLSTLTVPDADLVSGTNYRWKVRMSDSAGTSAWSPTCAFTYDTTPPSTPAISSSNFPVGDWGPIGQLVSFTFTDADPTASGFVYDWSQQLPVQSCSYSGPHGELVCSDPLRQPDVVRADAPGAGTTIHVNSPSSGPETFSIEAIDRAGNTSSSVSYVANVPSSGPSVPKPDGTQQVCGTSLTIRLAPHDGVEDVTSYNYGYQEGPSGSIPANAQGNAWATIPVPSGTGSVYQALNVTSVSSNGFISTAARMYLDIRPRPSVSSDIYLQRRSGGGPGIAGAFTFSPPETSFPSGYEYQFGTEPAHTVEADPSTATAAIQWAPADAGPQVLTVRAVPGDGVPASCVARYRFVVAPGS